jgi:predicted nucleic acid-binding protein
MSSIVVADARPLHYLVLVDCASALEKLFDRVYVPFAVRDELLHGSGPEKVKNWISASKSWLEFRQVTDLQPIHGLHEGEVEAIQLALRIKAAGVLMDDMDGRHAARELGLTVIGTVGLLERAAEENLIDLADAIAKLRQTNFFISPELLEAALDRDRQRRNKS